MRVDDQKLTREAQLEVGEADVRVAKAGNGIWLEANGGYIVNRSGCRCRRKTVWKCSSQVKPLKVIDLDSEDGCNVWPEGRRAEKKSKLLPAHTAEACSVSWVSIQLGFRRPR